MAGKFIELEEAAKMLGMSVEKLTELRQRGEIHGYRDGASWKFKPEEIERVAEEFELEMHSQQAAGGAGDDLDDVLQLADEELQLSDDDSVLSGDKDAGGLEEASSTVVGKEKTAASGPASDLKLASDEGSDISLASESPDGGSSNVLGDEELKPAAGSGTGELELGSDALGSDAMDDALELGDDDELALGDDDDLVLGGSGIGSDVSLDAAGSGINLASPSDSGLSLEEEPLDITGSGAESLELGEDFEEDVISLDDAMADPDEATHLKQDEEFLLSPSGDAGDESDSGSQVIALEDSEAFDENAATMLRPTEPSMLVEADEALGAPLEGLDQAAMVTGPAAGAAAMMPAQLPEAPYSIWNVLGLLSCTLVLVLAGFLTVDVIRNMWSWNGGTAGTGLMDLFTGAF